VAEDLRNFSGLPREAINVIHNPIVTPELSRLAGEAVAHPWFAKKDTPVILGAGRLSQQKDFVNLIRAFSILRQTRHARLVIIGQGPERPELERLVDQLQLREQVDMPGFAANPYALMRRADLFVLSSAWEGLPTVLVEAMACGAPVVATDCPSGPQEILEGGRHGRLVPVGDSEALGRAMIETLDDPPPASALVRRADDFGLARSVDAYKEILFEG
jgi:glycosyltransferase involved in cell wall biosynthesis